MTEERQKEMYSALIDLGTREAIDLILNCHGRQLLNDDFYEFLLEEEILEEKMIEYEDDDEEEETDVDYHYENGECVRRSV
jgi:hypothetical protein